MSILSDAFDKMQEEESRVIHFLVIPGANLDNLECAMTILQDQGFRVELHVGEES